jgi:hypothetical protein
MSLDRDVHVQQQVPVPYMRSAVAFLSAYLSNIERVLPTERGLSRRTVTSATNGVNASAT